MSNMVVQTNVMALGSHRNMKMVGVLQSRSSQKLSSGYKINSAADDAAGLAISEKMRSQIRGLDMASKNAADAQSLIQTAEGGMQEIDNMLQRMNELVNYASTDTMDQKTETDKQGDRQKVQDELDQLVAEIDSMTTRVQFNGKNLIDGTYASGTQKNLPNIQTTYGGSTGGATNSTTGSAAVGQLSESAKAQIRADVTDMIGAMKVSADYQNYIAGEKLNEPGTAYNATKLDALMDKLYALNDSTMTTATATRDAFNTLFKDYNDKTLATGYDGDEQAAQANLLKAVDAIYEKMQELVPVSDGTYAADFDKVIQAAVDSSYKAKPTNFNSTFKSANSGDLKTILDDTANYSEAKVAWEALQKSSTRDEMESRYNDFLAALETGSEKEAKALNSNVDAAGDLDSSDDVVVPPAAGSATTKGAAFLNNVTTADGGNPGAYANSGGLYELVGKAMMDLGAAIDRANGSSMTVGGVAQKGSTLYFQVGANANQGIYANIESVNSAALGLGDGKGNSYIDVMDQTGANITGLLEGVQSALTVVTTERSKLGAISNRLDYTMKSLDVSSENLSAAESRVRDTDMAKEMMNLTKSNVLQQASISMLAQANQAPQSLLSLLQ